MSVLILLPDGIFPKRSLKTTPVTFRPCIDIETWFLVIEKGKKSIGMSCSSPVVKVSDHGRHVMSSSPVPLKTRCVGQRYTLNLSRAQTFSRWCGVLVRRGGTSSGVVYVT
ncbi:uncharacterized protein TNCV_4101631 [Trichonephila clavipes]|nr:uncharacterized protein TNCV_4101631 [Trichonephila clavipes]